MCEPLRQNDGVVYFDSNKQLRLENRNHSNKLKSLNFKIKLIKSLFSLCPFGKLYNLYLLSFRSVSESDYGVYEIKVNLQSTHRFNLTLIRSEVPGLLKQATIAWIIILILVVCIVILLIILWQFPYVKVFYKRYFAAYIIGKLTIIKIFVCQIYCIVSSSRSLFKVIFSNLLVCFLM